MITSASCKRVAWNSGGKTKHCLWCADLQEICLSLAVIVDHVFWDCNDFRRKRTSDFLDTIFLDIISLDNISSSQNGQCLKRERMMQMLRRDRECTGLITSNGGRQCLVEQWSKRRRSGGATTAADALERRGKRVGRREQCDSITGIVTDDGIRMA